MDQPKLKNVYSIIKIVNLSIENINFYLVCINIQSCQDCQTMQERTKLE